MVVQFRQMMRGELPFPWEDVNDPQRSANLKKLGFMTHGILGMLARSPLERLKLTDVQHQWKKVLGAETTQMTAAMY